MIYFKFYYDIDQKTMIEMIFENKLYISKESRFGQYIDIIEAGMEVPAFSYVMDLDFYINSFSIVVAYDGDIPVGICVFEHYPFWGNGQFYSFRKNSKKYRFNVFGFIGLYVDKRYRRMGIASLMVENLESNLLSTFNLDDKIVPLISGLGVSFCILYSKLSYFGATKSPDDPYIWKNDAKAFVTFYYVSRINSLNKKNTIRRGL